MTSDPKWFMPIVLTSATLCSTGLGGITAFKCRNHLHILLGFSSGAVIGVALFDELPEVVTLGGAPRISVVAIGFLAFFALERYTAMRRSEGNSKTNTSNCQKLGVLSAGGLCVHSFLDGVAIGVGFQTA